MKEVDPILEVIGGRGKYQIIQYYFVSLSIFSAAFQLLNIVFIGRNIPHLCKKPANLSDVFGAIDDDLFDVNNSVVYFSKCQIQVETNTSGISHSTNIPCLFGYEYEEAKEISVMSDMDIVCDRAPLRSLGQTLLILGQGLGALTLPILSDKYGRRVVLVGSHFIFLGFAVAVAFAPDFTSFLVLRTFLGFAQQGIVLANTTLNVEMFSKRNRKVIGLLGTALWTPCVCMISVIAYLMQSYSWRYTQLVYSSVSLYSIVQIFTVEESLSWLIVNRKVKRAQKLLTKAAKISGKDVTTVLKLYERYEDNQIVSRHSTYVNEQDNRLLGAEEEKKIEKTKDPTKPSFLDLLKRKRMALTVLILWFMWITDSMTFFGLYMTAHSLAGDRYVNFILYGLVEAPSILVFHFMVDRYGRKKTSMTLHSIGGIALILSTIINRVGTGVSWSGTAVTVFSCIGMFGAAGAFGVTFFFTTELFPTNLRNFGLGTASAFSRIGGMLAPFSSLLAEYVPWAPGAIFGGCCLLVSILTILLPETMGRELPQTLDDMEEWYKATPPKKTPNNLTERPL